MEKRFRGEKIRTCLAKAAALIPTYRPALGLLHPSSFHILLHHTSPYNLARISRRNRLESLALPAT